MSEPPPLQFDQAEYAQPQASSCGNCNGAIAGAFYTLNGKTLCAHCRAGILAWQKGSSGRDVLRAFGWGGGAALLGAGVFYAVRALTGYEIGLIAILVGYFVGKGVARGARQRGGAGYQVLAIVLTYLSIALNFVPEVVRAWHAHPPHGGAETALAFAVYCGLALAAPVIACVNAPISIFIYGLGLYEAWKRNKRPKLAFTGPHVAASDKPASGDGERGPTSDG